MPEVTATDGAVIHYVVQGDGGPTVFCLHALGAQAKSWQGFWEACALPDVRWVAVDLRGHGGTRAAPGPISATAAARDVLRVAGELGAESFAVVGHSLGGKLALRLAALAPERVRALVLLGSVGPGLVPLERGAVEPLLERSHDVPFLREAFAGWFRLSGNGAVDFYLQTFARTPNWALRAALEMAAWTDLTAEIGTVRVPALVVAGEADPVYGPEYQRTAVLPCLADARLAVVERCGHGLALERPAEIGHLLIDFLNLPG